MFRHALLVLGIASLPSCGPVQEKLPDHPPTLPFEVLSERPDHLLILPFEVLSERKAYASLGKGLPDILTVCLTPAAGSFHIVDREHLEAVLREHTLRLADLLKKESLPELGQLSQAAYALRGSLSEIDGSLEIRAMLHETESGRLLKAFGSSCEPEKIPEACLKISKQIRAFLAKRLKKPAELPAEEHPQRMQHLIRGLGHYYNGRTHRAIPEFMAVLRKDPRDAVARYWLGKCFRAAGLADHAVLEFKRFLKDFPDDPKTQEVERILQKLN